MKNYLILALAILSFQSAFTQAPDAFKYQAVVRDATGGIVSNQSVNFRMSIYENAVTGIVVYSETHGVTTNDFGLANLTIGTGTLVSGDFGTIDWSNDVYFIRTEVDVTGGNTFTDMGITQLLSVPYALSAKKVTGMELGDLTDVDASGAAADEVLTWNGTAWVPVSPATAPTYTAGAGIDITGNTISNAAPDQTVTLTTVGATSVSGAYPNFILTTTDNNTTYSAGTGLSLSGTTFNANNQSALWNASRIQGNTVASTTPNTGQVLTWNGTQWTPQAASSPWTVSGSNIYRNSGLIGIGMMFPQYPLHATSTSGTTIQAEVTGNSAVNSAFGGFATATNTTGENQGIYAQATNSTVANVGGIFVSNGTGSGTNYGVFASANGSTSNNYAGYFLGNVAYTGSLANVSDQRLKTNITPYNGALNSLMDLSIYRYSYKATAEYSNLNLAKERQYGFLAQDVEQLFPDLVHENKVPNRRVMQENGRFELVGGGAEYKSVNQIGMVPILIKAMQEQQDIIMDQQSHLRELRTLVEALEQRVTSLENGQ